MKTIGDFLEGKVRRSEATDVLQVERQGEPDPDFGPLEGRLVSASGQSEFYQEGLVLSDGKRIAYDDVITVTISPPEEDQKLVHIIGTKGEKLRLRCSEKGGIVLHATLRWIGNTASKRKIRR